MVRRGATRVILGVVLLVVLLVGGTAFRIWQIGGVDDRRHSDVILVLGTTQANGVPKPVFQARLDHARALYNDGVAPRVLTVGSRKPGDNYTEAQAGARYLNHHGVPHSALVTVNHGNDTLGSLRAAADVLHEHSWGSAVIVSDPWHELRARTMARDAGIAAWTSPTENGPMVHGGSTERHYIVRETAALLYYRLTKASVTAVE